MRHRPHRAAMLLAAALVTAAAPATAAAQAPPTTDPGDPLAQTIDADQQIATGPAELSSGHVDIGPRLAGDDWALMVHDDSVIPSVWRSLDDAVIQVTDDALQTVPDDPTYGFLGVDPGTEVHVVPQVQRPGVVWVGWNTQDPEVLARIDRGATLTLLGVQGPGALTMYLQAGNLTEP
ncbi:MAG TPA: choice-of-anchor M domain-containing protein, partial [Ilumatobacter sp.]|nr:choice-of-anchor M domain-containing protein [Ilumatobacter sp.]